MLFPYFRQQLTNQIKEGHQRAIEEKDAAIALLNDDLQKREYENVALQAQKDDMSYKNVIIPSHILNPGKDNTINIVRKHTTPANDKYHDLPYYVARIQRRKRYIKLGWFDQHFPDHEVIVEIDNPNSIQAFNRFKEEEHAEPRYNHFRLIDLTREELHAIGVPAIFHDEEEEEEEEFFFQRGDLV